MKAARRAVLSGSAAALVAAAAPGPAGAPALRVGALAYGSVAWELAVIRLRNLAPDLPIETVPLAGTPAAQVALLGGRVDTIVQDWLWVSRQRAAGSALALSPTSAAVGAIVVPAGAAWHGLADLVGRRLGVAGSPLDKSFLIMRAYARRMLQLDLAAAVTLQFGAPPLLQAELAVGRLDAVLTYWPFAARAEAAGMRSLLSVEQAVQALGAAPGLPFVGYVFFQSWAQAHRPALAAFLDAGRRARMILLHEDAIWQAVRPLTGAGSDGELARLRTWYRSGVAGPTTAAQIADAARLYDVLAGLGGPGLVGSARHLTPGTFWTG